MKKIFAVGAICAVMFLMVMMSASAQTSINIGPLPVYVSANVVITGQSSVREQYVGGNVDLYVTATGAGLTYQWSGPAGPIGGAINSGLTISGVVLGDTGTYTCEVGGTCGFPVTTAPITVTIYEVLAGIIVTNPAVIPYALCPFDTIDLTADVGTTGKAPYIYVWSVDTGTGPGLLVNGFSAGGGVIAGADAANLTITNAGLLDEAVPGYSCLVTDSPLVNTNI